MASDSERLDWLEALFLKGWKVGLPSEDAPGWVIAPPNSIWVWDQIKGSTLRAAIDKAMKAEED